MANNGTSPVNTVSFTPRQVEWLNQKYPEWTGTATTTAEERAWRSAQRSVVLHITSHIQRG